MLQYSTVESDIIIQILDRISPMDIHFDTWNISFYKISNHYRMNSQNHKPHNYGKCTKEKHYHQDTTNYQYSIITTGKALKDHATYNFHVIIEY